MPLTRRSLLAAAPASALAAALPARAWDAPPDALLGEALAAASGLSQLRTVIVAHDGEVLAERTYAGPPPDVPVNIKSASKTVLSALVGIAVGEGALSLDRTLGELIPDRVPEDADPRASSITVRDLLTMRAGLRSTSGRGYGPWVVSDDWVAYALSAPMTADPGARMTYSTGSSHLLGVVLAAATGDSLLTLAREGLGEPLGIEVPPWTRDPQGAFMGGNEMALSPQALLAFGEAYRRGGVHDGARVLPKDWVAESWTPRGRSRWSGAAYGYGWWLGRAGGHRLAYAWGYGGQMVYVAPTLGLTAVMTSDPNARGVSGHVQALHGLVADYLVPMARRMRAES